MALSKGTKWAIGLGVGAAALFGFSQLANADDGLPDFIPDVPPPPGPDVPVPTTPDTPLPPKPKKCNYVGCAVFDTAHKTTGRNEGLRLQQLGYPLNPAAANFDITSDGARKVVREFQRNYNTVRKFQKFEVPPPPALDTDGLVGTNTIAAISKAQQWVLLTKKPWIELFEAAAAAS